MNKLECAIYLAREGFYVFPLTAGGKTPRIRNWQEMATRHEGQIAMWWKERPYSNIGIYTGKYGDGDQALLVVDVDNKNGQEGDETVFKMELEGNLFPETLTQKTPTGGKHFIYLVPEALKNSVKALGKGLDTRSGGGYIVGAGSIVSNVTYKFTEILPLVPAPQWLVDRFGKSGAVRKKPKALSKIVTPPDAVERARFYLQFDCPTAHSGERNHRCYVDACYIKDLGVVCGDAIDLMLELWPCEPMLDHDELISTVEKAYIHGQNAIGSASPEAHFQPIESEGEKKTPLHPFEELNREYAYALISGKSSILWETTDYQGRPSLVHLSIDAFEEKLAAGVMDSGGKLKPITSLWLRSPKRRSYDGLVFSPGKPCDPRYYNLWKGFQVRPLEKGEAPTDRAQRGLDAFLEHALENVCSGDRKHFSWLMGYFAHLIQKPWEKPLTALVMRGKKGVGKNALIDRVGHLLGRHYLLTSDRNNLVGRFNSHLEHNLLFTLDEAFWSGDKQAEGILKNLITGNKHNIERKGREMYQVDNCSRIVILGNEDWLVPATQDERRFAVFNVGDGRFQDTEFFRQMREDMENGGYELLLRYFMDYDLSGINVNVAPKTEGLHQQKIAGLDPFALWWYESLKEGTLLGLPTHNGSFPEQLDKDQFRQAYQSFMSERQIKGRRIAENSLGRMLRSFAPSIPLGQKRREGDGTVNIYRFPALAALRKDWEDYIGHHATWDEEGEIFDTPSAPKPGSEGFLSLV